MDANRSYRIMSKADLHRLARVGAQQREDFFTRHPEFALLYRRRLLCDALAGEAAVHYVNGTTGLIEFNLWWFFAEHPEAAFPFHMVDHADLGPSKFGRALDAPDGYVGRRVTIQGRSLDAAPNDDPLQALQRYLRAGASPTARELAATTIVLIGPEAWLGMLAWPALLLRDPDS
jgi:hypothetical protein